MTQHVRASPAPASAGDAVTPEWWETIATRFTRWKGRRSEVWVRLRTARWVLLWVTLVGAVVLASVLPAVRAVLVVALSGVLMLVAMYAVARTKTMSWQAIGLLYSASLWWAMAIAAISVWVTVDVTGLFDNAIVRYSPVAAAGAGTAVAALTEECMKLVPLAVLAVVAPGRVRRFATVDWLLVAAMAIDAQRVWPARRVGGLPDAPEWALRWTARPGLVGAMGCLAALVVRDLQVVVAAHARDGAEPRRAAAARGRAAAVMLRVLRAEELRARVDGAPRAAVVSARRRVRWWGWAALAVLGVIGTLGAAWLAVRIGPLLLKVFVTGWFAGVLEGLGEWWNGLPLWQQIAIGVGIAALIALSGGSLGLAFGVSGVVTYGLSHGRGLGALVRDPQGATDRYLTEATPGGVALDLLDFGLTFAPGNFAGAAAGRGIRQVAREFADDPDAFRAAVRARHLDDTGSVELPPLRGMAAADLRAVLETWPNPRVHFGNVELLVDKADIKHVLERHHPTYWNGETKNRQSFFDPQLTPQDIRDIAVEVLKQNREAVIATGGYKPLQVYANLDGHHYTVGLRQGGHIRQIYPGLPLGVKEP